ncbi:CIA30 family protein [Christiangramia sp. OXR-203]|uniref:CIA30 family protein n=1 Tax=Christiangramia sp. OXR-203 TaxID=3100176 RepID=UPI002AC8CE6A|nr:CIA30 family protein [Christiangramia sp. OXR-203]WPY99463.1 CIA30 family protein [Christiangramia sp. OXR-203]
MIRITLIIIILFSVNEKLIFDFNSDTKISNWVVVEDRVMGGRSNAEIHLTDEGHAKFIGNVSLENNGGFASVRHRLNVEGVKNFSKAVIRLKGDGKNYQFRLKNKLNDRHSYIQEFSTNGEWQEIEFDLAKMYPGFRGRKLDIPNWDHDIIQEITFLIGNKKNEEFSLLIDYIRLK